MDKAKIIIVNILKIIEYKDDKEIFADNFLVLCNTRTISDLIESLPENKKNELLGNFKSTPELKTKIEKIQKIFSLKEVEEMLFKVTVILLEDYLQTIQPTLSEKQKDKLASYLASIN